MDKKNIQTLLIIFAVLVGGILIRQQQAHRGVVTEDYAALDFSFESAQAAKITLSRGAQTELTAVKETGSWVLPDLWNVKADTEKIESFLSGLSSVHGELRAEDASLLSDFGIADESALAIQLTDVKGIVLADLKVGTKRAGPASVFMRRSGSSAVFLADLDLFQMLGIYDAEIKEPLQPRLWADLEPLNFRSVDLTGLTTLRYDGAKPLTALQLKREAGENKPWTFAGTYSHFAIDAPKVETFIRALSTLRASNVVDPAGSYGFDTPALQIKVQTAEKSWTLTMGQESADQRSRYLRVEGDSSIYEIAKFSFEDLAADDSRFFVSGLSGLDKAVVAAVTLAKQGREQRFTSTDTNAFESIQQTLRTLGYAGLLLSDDEKKKSRSPGLDTVTVEMNGGEKIILDIGEQLKGNEAQGNRYAAQIRGDTTVFSISESEYNILFEALKPPPASAKTNPSQPAPNKAE